MTVVIEAGLFVRVGRSNPVVRVGRSNPVATAPGSVVACLVQQPGRYRSRFCSCVARPMPNVQCQTSNDKCSGRYCSRFCIGRGM